MIKYILTIILLIPTLVFASGSGVVMSGGTSVAEIGGLPGNPIGAWPLNSTLDDISGNGHTLTCSGTGCPTYVTGHGSTADSAWEGVYAQSRYIYKASDHADFDFSSAFTIGGWYDGVSYGCIATKRGAGTNLSYALCFRNTTKKWECSVSTNGTTWAATAISSAYSTPAWRNIACKYDGSNITILVNGSVDSTDDNPKACTGTVYNGSALFEIGGYGGGLNWFADDNIDDVWAYDYAISDANILYIYGLGDNFE